MEKLLAIIYFFGILSVICPIINYVYLFLATRLKFHKTFVGWLLDDDDYTFFMPLVSWVITFVIVVYILYWLILKPLYYVLAMLPLEAIKWLSKILMKPIKKTQFKNRIEESL